MIISNAIPHGHRLALSAIIVAAAFSAVPVESADDGKEAGERLVDTLVNEVHSMSGRFEQSLVDADDNVTETSSGTFAILRPGRFRWVYEKPYEQILVADGTNVWNYDVDLEQVTVKPQTEALGSTPAALLGGSEDVLDSFDVRSSFTDRGTDWVRLEPKTHETSFETVELGFTNGVLTRMILSDELEQTTLVALLGVKVNEDMDPSRFEFSPPEHVDLVGRPAAAPGD
ncbi:MAG TPA: outer membrane lipoprotein chaperone LolA [Woeseiaceae bacterium]|nr:outer membrane lipoprotein chaperone LolA [Woeseiaceae bacterium]